MKDLPTTVENPLCYGGDSFDKPKVVQPVGKSEKKTRRLTFTRKGAKKAQEALKDNVDSLTSQEADLMEKIRLLKQEYDEIAKEKEKQLKLTAAAKKQQEEETDSFRLRIAVHKDRLALIDEFKGMDIEAEIKKLKAEKKTLESTVETLQQDKDGLLKQVDGLERRKNDLIETVKKADFDVDVKKTEIGKANTRLAELRMEHETLQNKFEMFKQKHETLQSLVKTNPHVEEYLKPKQIDPDKTVSMSQLHEQFQSRLLAGIKEKIESFVPSSDEIMAGCMDGKYVFLENGTNCVVLMQDGERKIFRYNPLTRHHYQPNDCRPFIIVLGNSNVKFTIVNSLKATINIDKKEISVYYILNQIKEGIKAIIPDVEFEMNTKYSINEYAVVCSK